MSKYEVKAIRHYSAVFLGDKRVTQWPVSDADACKIVDMLNQETAPLLDELATKDAVIEALTGRIKELERELAKYQPRFKVGDIVSNRYRKVKIEQFYDDSIVQFSYLVTPVNFDWKEIAVEKDLQPLEESEADNG